VIAAGALGSFLGDNTAYGVGRRMSAAIHRWAERKPKREARLRWANAQIRQRGGLLLVTARFIPGGRTALTVSSGITHQPRLWFAAWIGVAAVIWASYAALLGYAGGKTFEDDHTKAFLFAFAAAFSLTVLIELFRHTRARRAARRDTEAAAALLEH
jgi:membrane protein DedA with SNARE-associated domain